VKRRASGQEEARAEEASGASEGRERGVVDSQVASWRRARQVERRERRTSGDEGEEGKEAIAEEGEWGRVEVRVWRGTG
jgi:hypothetical protein